MMNPSSSSSNSGAACIRQRTLWTAAAAASLGLSFLTACGDTIHEHYYLQGPAAGSGGVSASTGGSGGRAGGASSGGSAGDDAPGGAGAPGAEYPGAPKADTDVGAHELAPFAASGTRFWLAVSDEQLEAMNESGSGGGVILDEPLDGDLYSPGGSNATFVDHLFITATDGKTADYGKVQAKLVGQSTRRTWNRRSIPNFNLDADHFVEGQRIGGFEHLRLNNAQVGGIFREHLTLELFRALGYPAPLSTYAWVSSNVWGADVAVPMVLVERYKRSFCEREQERLPAGCVNMWEMVGDFARDDGGFPIPLAEPARLPVPSAFDNPANCQLEECDNARVKELEALLSELPLADGFRAATEEYVDWQEFHRFQCLSWMLGTGDDAIHASNNVVLVERTDGKFQYLPYSVDLSLGQDWFANVPLAGQNVLARGCQADAACWADTVATCETLIETLTELEPVRMLEDVYGELESHGMLRDGDEQRYEFLQSWLEARMASLPAELEANRESPGACGDGLVDCGGYCDLPENCAGGVPCVIPVLGPARLREQAAGGAASEEEPPAEAGAPNPPVPGECPMRTLYNPE